MSPRGRDTLEILRLSTSQERGFWDSHTDFVMSAIAMMVGLGNIWRFPALAHQNGGAAFLIPYLVLHIFVGFPMVLLEFTIGQYSGKGPVRIWSISYASRGIGISSMLSTSIGVVYYNVIMAHAMFFFFSSFQRELPWTTCRQEWINLGCYSEGSNYSIPKCSGTTYRGNISCKCSGRIQDDFDMHHLCSNDTANYDSLVKRAAKKDCEGLQKCTNSTHSPAFFYFSKVVLERSENITHMGTPVWYLTYCLLLSWIIICGCLTQGFTSAGKVVYFTVTFPYLVLFCLFLNEVTREGAVTGITYYIVPEWDKLADMRVWKIAGDCMFFSLSLAIGSLSTLSSYNKYDSNIYRDSLFICMADFFTSFFSGLVIFSSLGVMAKETGRSIHEYESEGLAFVVFPETLSRMAGGTYWSMSFFLMMYLIALDTEFMMVEVVLTSIKDELKYFRKHAVPLCAIFCFVCFLFGLPMVSPGGVYLLDIVATFGNDFTKMFAAIAELVFCCWIHGSNKLMDMLCGMIGYQPTLRKFWIFCWSFATPFIMIALLFLWIRRLLYQIDTLMAATLIGYELGWVIFAVVLLPIPFWCIYAICRTSGRNICAKLSNACSPTAEWGPQVDPSRFATKVAGAAIERSNH